MSEHYQLRCRECGRTWGNIPRSYCEECLSPLEVAYDYAALKGRVTRESIAARAGNLWRYAELLPLPEGFRSDLPVGFTPLVRANRLAKQLGVSELYVKNDAVCFPSLSFKDRVVAVALTAARRFGYEVVSCSSTGNLANAVAAQAAREGFQACIFVPADLEAAKILNTQVYGARLVRIAGNYDQVNRLCSQIADSYPWGFVNVNLRPYYAEGSKTVGFEIAEQLGWRLPDNVVVPMAGGALIGKIIKAFRELTELGLVEGKSVKFFGGQATGCSPISDAVKNGKAEFDPQKPNTIARSLAIGNPADGNYASAAILKSGGWAEDVSDSEIVEAVELLAQSEGIFGETAGGVTLGVTRKLIEQGRIAPNHTTVICNTGNGLKTTDALAGRFELSEPIPPRLADFESAMAGAFTSATAAGKHAVAGR
ncbi:MAG TPA: threonine synthase [Candidatus Limnocylindrales bacterium]|nr:threonine synthase [Candidatus Limnocylindrales bacterium]